MPEHADILRTAYAAIGRGDIERVLAHLDPGEAREAFYEHARG